MLSKFRVFISKLLVLLIVFYIICSLVVGCLTTQQVMDHNNFLPGNKLDFSEIITKITNTLFITIINITQPIEVQGYFDDLIGQRLLIELTLYFTSVCVLLLIIIFFLNLLLYLNKSNFNSILISWFGDNRLIQGYSKVQFLLVKFSLFIFPIFIMLGLYIIVHGLHWLVYHTIPY